MNPTIKRHSQNIKGYKAVLKDKDGYYTNGMGNGEETYLKKGQIIEVKGEPHLCQNGIHFFRHLCFAIDYLRIGNDIIEVESIGEVEEDTEKCVTNKIKIGKKVSKTLIKKIISNNSNSGNRNSGDSNSGYRNSGDRNSGDSNSGDSNSGYRNSGNWNSGNWNSGYRNSGNSNSGYRNSGNSNSGYRNSGDRNSGDSNSGYRNSGNWNSGNWNSGNWNSGCFNSKTPKKILIFNKLVDKEIWDNAYKPSFLFFDLDVNLTYKENFQKSWDNADKDDRIKVKDLPNFNTKVFYEITGIKV